MARVQSYTSAHIDQLIADEVARGDAAYAPIGEPVGTAAQTAADAAQSSANAAQTSANNAQTAANAAQTSANNALAYAQIHGIVVVADAFSRPASPFEGMVVYEQNVDRFAFYNGTSWIYEDVNSAKPVCSVSTAVGGNFAASGTWYGLAGWDTELEDLWSMHDTSTNPNRIIMPVAGVYRIDYEVSFATNTTGYRSVNLRKNSGGSQSGGTNLEQSITAAVSGSATTVRGYRVERFAANDYVELFGYQTSGGALAWSAGTPLNSFAVEFLRK